RNKNVFSIPHLVVLIQNGVFRICSHTGCSHLVDTHTESIFVVVCINIFYTDLLQHLLHFVLHVATHFLLVIFYFHIHGQDLNFPFVLFVLIYIDSIFMIRQDFTECRKPDCPISRLKHSVFPVAAYTHFSDLSRPTAAACSALITKPAYIVAFFCITIYVDKPWYI